MDLFRIPFFNNMEEKPKIILNIVNCLLGSYIRIREIHWNTRNQAAHNLTNSMLPEIIDYVDTLIELLSGVSERPGFDILKPIIPSTKDLREIIMAMTMKVEACNDCLSDPAYRGIVKTLDDLIADLNRWKYLSENF